MAGERRGEVVAQAQPLLVIVLQRKHAGVRPVGIGQEFAERVGIFERRGLDRLETIRLVDPPNGGEHVRLGAQIVGGPIDKAARHPRLDPRRFLLLFSHDDAAIRMGSMDTGKSPVLAGVPVTRAANFGKAMGWVEGGATRCRTKRRLAPCGRESLFVELCRAQRGYKPQKRQVRGVTEPTAAAMADKSPNTHPSFTLDDEGAGLQTSSSRP